MQCFDAEYMTSNCTSWQVALQFAFAYGFANLPLFPIFSSQAKQVTPWSSQGGNTSKNRLIFHTAPHHPGAGFQVLQMF